MHATVEIGCYRATISTGSDATLWKNHTITNDEGGFTSFIADKTAYYAPRIRNASSETITLSSISVEF